MQQQALRDFTRAMKAFFDPGNPAGRPSWRKAGRDEGFRIVGRGRQWDVRRVSRKVGQIWVLGQVDRDSRESQAAFRCTACRFAGHADVNAAINIAAGHAVTARGGNGVTRPVNREPQLLLRSA